MTLSQLNEWTDKLAETLKAKGKKKVSVKPYLLLRPRLSRSLKRPRTPLASKKWA